MPTSVIPFPQIVVTAFSEHRVRRPIKGADDGECVDIVTPETISTQVRRFLADTAVIPFSPYTSYASCEIGDKRLISTCYVLASVDKSSAVRALYGA